VRKRSLVAFLLATALVLPAVLIDFRAVRLGPEWTFILVLPVLPVAAVVYGATSILVGHSMDRVQAIISYVITWILLFGLIRRVSWKRRSSRQP